jgi:hypothetical protein
VPFLNLVRPYQVMREVWAGTAYLAGTARVRSWQNARVSPLVGIWWGLLLASGAAARISLGLQSRIDTVPALLQGAWASIASSVLSIAAALAAVLIVRRITELQETAAALGDEPA